MVKLLLQHFASPFCIDRQGVSVDMLTDDPGIQNLLTKGKLVSGFLCQVQNCDEVQREREALTVV